MSGKALFFALWLLVSGLAFSAAAQSVPNGGSITQGQVWSAAQWNAAWQAKCDYPCLVSSLSGTVAPTQGGTGLASVTANALLYGAGTGALGVLAPGTSGYCLVSAGSSAPPAWASCPGGSGAVSSVSGSGLVAVSPTTGATVVSLGAVGANTLLGNNTGSSAAPVALSNATVAAALSGQTTTTLANGQDSRFAGPTQNSQSAAYSFALTDQGGQVYHPYSDTTARTWTLNTALGWQVGMKIDLINDCSAGTLTLAVTGGGSYIAFPSGNTGTRTLSACGEATVTYMGAGRFAITGTNLS